MKKSKKYLEREATNTSGYIIRLYNYPDWFLEYDKEYRRGIKCDMNEINKIIKPFPNDMYAIIISEDGIEEKYKWYNNFEIELSITTYQGISPGAIHYYGRFNGYGGFGTNIIQWGFKSINNISINVTKLATKEDIRTISYLRERDLGIIYTSHFLNKDLLLKTAKDFFNKYFDKRYVLKIEDNTG